MELLHMCRLCLKNSDYHFNIFTEIISNNHLYQLINKICELGILSKLKEKEQVEDAVDSAFDQSTINQATIKREIGIDEIAIPAEQVTIEKIIEMDVIASLEHLNEMETILAGKEKSVSQEKTYPCCEASLRRSAHVCGALLKGCICQLAIKNETDIGEIVIPAEQIEILKITEMERSASFEHFNELEIIPAVIEKSESKEFLEVRGKLKCYHCGEKRETKKEIAQHIEDVHNSIFNEDNIPIQQQREDKKHSCSMCDRRYKEKSHLKRHMRKHTGEKPFQCNICNYSCAQHNNLKVHMQIHTGEKPFQCNVCTYRCIARGSLTVHMRKHTGERPFKCNICNYRCAHSGNLKVHMLKHTVENPFHCNICNYSCSQRGHLQVHMQKRTGKKK